MAIWLGVTRVGGVVALLNTNLTGTALAHCINIVKPKHIIVAAELLAALRDRARRISPATPKIWLHGDADAQRTRASIATIDAPVRRRRSPASERCRAHHRGPRALHLHVRHHRPAEGRQHQSLPRDAGEPRLRRRDGHPADRPHVRLPADVPHRRRRGGDRRAAGQRRLGGDPRADSRRASSGTTSCAGTARCSSISASSAAISSTRRRSPKETRAPAAARLRQRPAARHLGGVQDAASAFRRSSSSTRATEGNVLAVQLRGQGPARSAASRGSSRTASRPRWCASTSSASSRCATPTASASTARRTRSAR